MQGLNFTCSAAIKHVHACNTSRSPSGMLEPQEALVLQHSMTPYTSSTALQMLVEGAFYPIHCCKADSCCRQASYQHVPFHSTVLPLHRQLLLFIGDFHTAILEGVVQGMVWRALTLANGVNTMPQVWQHPEEAAIILQDLPLLLLLLLLQSSLVHTSLICIAFITFFGPYLHSTSKEGTTPTILNNGFSSIFTIILLPSYSPDITAALECHLAASCSRSTWDLVAIHISSPTPQMRLTNPTGMRLPPHTGQWI